MDEAYYDRDVLRVFLLWYDQNANIAYSWLDIFSASCWLMKS